MQIWKIIKEYYEQLHDNKLDSLNAMDKFLERHELPKLTQEGWLDGSVGSSVSSEQLGCQFDSHMDPWAALSTTRLKIMSSCWAPEGWQNGSVG